MFSDIGSVRAELEARLTAALPEEWRIVPTIGDAIKALVPVVYIEFTDLSGAINGVPLSRQQVAASGDILIASAETDDVKGENAADQGALLIAQAIQAMPDLYWDTAKKERMNKGPLAWRLHFTALTNMPSIDG